MSMIRKLDRTARKFATGSYAAAFGCAVLGTPARAANCDQTQLATAVDQAGDKLRQLTIATQPALKTKMLKLKQVKGWSDQDYEEKGYAALEDQRTATLDIAANDLLTRLDRLGDTAGAAPDCERIAEVEAVSLELQATIRTKSQYVLARLDQLTGEPAAAAPAKPAIVATVPTTPPPAAAMPKTPPLSKADPRWAAQTKAVPPAPPPQSPPPSAAAPPPQPLPPVAQVDDGYTIDEIVAASSGLFGKVSANLARVLEHAFSKSGRPTGYILGQETGGAFIAGVRYGSGTMYLRSGGTLPIYWHGPSLGADIGAQGASTLFLVYKVREVEDVFANFTGIEGSAFVVGGLGITFMSNGKVDMAPIRSGIGLRLGANVGYVRFTSRPTWNPF